MFVFKVFAYFLLSVSIISICEAETAGESCSLSDYTSKREKIVAQELAMSFGSRIILDEEEDRANQILMKYKSEELQSAVWGRGTFLPSRSFSRVAREIEKSRVFRAIRRMPKGGLLHAHAHAMIPREYLLSNVTHRPGLYLCREGGRARLRFFNETGAKSRRDCHWEPLELVRTRDQLVDAEIEKALSMFEEEDEEDTAWRKFLRIFEFVKPLITYRPVYEDSLYQLLEELHQDNVQFVEVRTPFSDLYELDGRRHDHLRVAEIGRAVVDRFVKDHPGFVGVKWIYSPQRNVRRSTFTEYVEIFRALKKSFPNLVTGFDLVGQEDRGRPLKDFVQELRILGRETDFFFHAGETNWSGQQVDENLIDAILLNSKRIGHGYALIKHPKLMELVKLKKICIEVCPISNQVLSLVKDMRNHPASYFFALNLPVVVSSDDEGFWGARGLSYDFYEAFVGIMSRRADLRALKQLAMNSVVHSGLNDTEKTLAMDVWASRWRKFVRDVVRQDE